MEKCVDAQSEKVLVSLPACSFVGVLRHVHVILKLVLERKVSKCDRLVNLASCCRNVFRRDVLGV
jgi:hypothetical protein